MSHIRDVSGESIQFSNDFVKKIKLDGVELAEGTAKVQIEIDDTYYYEMLSDMTGVPIEGEYQLISMIKDLSALKKSMRMCRMRSMRFADAAMG